jgi:hypothetical protein
VSICHTSPSQKDSDWAQLRIWHLATEIVARRAPVVDERRRRRRRRRVQSQQPILTDGQAVIDGADGVGDDGHYAANNNLGGLLLRRLGSTNPQREGRPCRTPPSLTTLPVASPTPI